MPRHAAPVDLTKGPRHAAQVDFTKSPLHRNALRLQDLTVGQHITMFNTENGIRGRYIVMQVPTVGCLGSLGLSQPIRISQRIIILVLLQDQSNPSADPVYASTADLGIATYSNGHWNGYNFTVDTRHEHLLPDPAPQRARLFV